MSTRNLYFLEYFRVVQFFQFLLIEKMLQDWFSELFRRETELLIELLDFEKKCLQKFLGVFKVLQFLGFSAYQKISFTRFYYRILLRGGGGG